MSVLYNVAITNKYTPTKGGKIEKTGRKIIFINQVIMRNMSEDKIWNMLNSRG